MKIYVTGHNGLVGSAIIINLKGKGYVDIVCRTSRELDLLRQSDTERFFEKERPEYVYLAAAKVGGIPIHISVMTSIFRRVILKAVN